MLEVLQLAQTHEDHGKGAQCLRAVFGYTASLIALMALSAIAPVMADSSSSVGTTATGSIQLRLVLPPRVVVKPPELTDTPGESTVGANAAGQLCLRHFPVGNIKVLWQENQPASESAPDHNVTSQPGNRGCYEMPRAAGESKAYQRVLIAAE